MGRALIAFLPLASACSTYQADAALSPLWPAFSACMAREQAKLPSGSQVGDAVAARCNAEAVLQSPQPSRAEK